MSDEESRVIGERARRALAEFGGSERERARIGLSPGAIAEISDLLGWELRYDNDRQIVLYTGEYKESREEATFTPARGKVKGERGALEVRCEGSCEELSQAVVEAWDMDTLVAFAEETLAAAYLNGGDEEGFQRDWRIFMEDPPSDVGVGAYTKDEDEEK